MPDDGATLGAVTTVDIGLSQGSIRYREYSEGLTVVLLHGAIVAMRVFQPTVEHLQKHVPCIVPELPLGSHELPAEPHADLSPRGLANLVVDLLEALDLRDVTLVGNDTGGVICQLVVTTRADRIGRVVMTNSDSFKQFPVSAFRPLVIAVHIPGGLWAMLAPTRFKRIRWLPISYGWLAKRRIPKESTDDWVMRCLQNDEVMRDLRKVFADFDAAILLDNEARLARVAVPALVVWASEDRFWAPAQAYRLAAAFADGRVVEIEDSYTFVCWDQPERLTDLIAEFRWRAEEIPHMRLNAVGGRSGPRDRRRLGGGGQDLRQIDGHWWLQLGRCRPTRGCGARPAGVDDDVR